MNDKTPSLQKIERQEALAQDRKKILNQTPEKALKTIAEHPYPVTLVQSMAEEDLYFLIHRIGPADALPIIAIASNQQWDYLLDMEGWERDQINTHQMTIWLNRLLKADSDRFTHWITNEKQDEIALYLFRNIELHIREYDQDPGEIDNDFFTEDQTYYIRMRPYPKEHQNRQEKRDLFIKDLLNRISVFDHTLYRNFLLASKAILPAETEEELYRQRNVRLAEKGLLPFDEAIGVYQPLKAADLPERSTKSDAFDGRIIDIYPLPVASKRPDQSANLFSQALSQIDDPAIMQKLQAEFASLCNQVISADKQHIQEKQALSFIVKKVGDYISIGLEKTISEMTNDQPYKAANLVQNRLLSDIFRVGYGCALSLKWRAEKWHRASWSANAGLPISFWGETYMGIIGGLLIKKPLYYDNYATGVLYREFASLYDIAKTEAQTNSIIAFDDLLSMMSIKIGATRGNSLLNYENLLLTLWANHYLSMGGNTKSPQPLTMEQFGHFFNALWQPGSEPRNISDTMRERFLQWLADSSGLSDYEISDRMAPALEQLFNKIEQELGNVNENDLNSRFITLFLLSEHTVSS